MADTWDKDWENIGEALNDVLGKTLRITAKHIAGLGIIISPVWTGSYVLSHRIGINKPSTRKPTRNWPEDSEFVDPRYPPKATRAEAARIKARARKELKKVAGAKAGDKVIISNTINHADEVEDIHGYRTYAHMENYAFHLGSEVGSNFKKFLYYGDDVPIEDEPDNDDDAVFLDDILGE